MVRPSCCWLAARPLMLGTVPCSLAPVGPQADACLLHRRYPWAADHPVHRTSRLKIAAVEATVTLFVVHSLSRPPVHGRRHIDHEAGSRGIDRPLLARPWPGHAGQLCRGGTAGRIVDGRAAARSSAFSARRKFTRLRPWRPLAQRPSRSHRARRQCLMVAVAGVVTVALRLLRALLPSRRSPRHARRVAAAVAGRWPGRTGALAVLGCCPDLHFLPRRWPARCRGRSAVVGQHHDESRISSLPLGSLADAHPRVSERSVFSCSSAPAPAAPFPGAARRTDRLGPDPAYDRLVTGLLQRLSTWSADVIQMAGSQLPASTFSVIALALMATDVPDQAGSPGHATVWPHTSAAEWSVLAVAPDSPCRWSVAPATPSNRGHRLAGIMGFGAGADLSSSGRTGPGSSPSSGRDALSVVLLLALIGRMTLP